MSFGRKSCSVILVVVMAVCIVFLVQSATSPGHVLDLSSDNTIQTKGDAWELVLIFGCSLVLIWQARNFFRDNKSNLPDEK